jgi:hypothetical protein
MGMYLMHVPSTNARDIHQLPRTFLFQKNLIVKNVNMIYVGERLLPLTFMIALGCKTQTNIFIHMSSNIEKALGKSLPLCII